MQKLKPQATQALWQSLGSKLCSPTETLLLLYNLALPDCYVATSGATHEESRAKGLPGNLGVHMFLHVPTTQKTFVLA